MVIRQRMANFKICVRGGRGGGVLPPQPPAVSNFHIFMMPTAARIKRMVVHLIILLDSINGKG